MRSCHEPTDHRPEAARRQIKIGTGFPSLPGLDRICSMVRSFARLRHRGTNLESRTCAVSVLADDRTPCGAAIARGFASPFITRAEPETIKAVIGGHAELREHTDPPLGKPRRVLDHAGGIRRGQGSHRF